MQKEVPSQASRSAAIFWYFEATQYMCTRIRIFSRYALMVVPLALM